MRIPSTLLILAVLAACGGGAEDAPAVEAEDSPMVSISDFAGTWDLSAQLVGVADPVRLGLSGSPGRSDWVMVFEGRDPVPVQVSMMGDSLITVSDPYESVLRDGVMVTTRSAAVMQDGGMVGKVLVTYDTEAGEEQVSGTLTGARGSM